MITRLSHSPVYVLDQAEALRIYVDQLGFEIRTDQTMGDYRWLTVGPRGQPDLEMILMEAREGPMADAESAAHLRALLEKGVMGAGVLETDDCRATYAELTARGVEFAGPPEAQPYGIEAIMKDGCGNWYSLMQRV
jgi:predicted enzyme related to lactoylglutathione lyase